MSNVNFSNFTSYKNTVMLLSNDLKKLKEICDEMDLVNNATAINETLNKLANDNFDIAIIGEFKRGKSTLINALLGKDVLPMDVLPATAAPNRVTYDVEKFVHVKFKDGHEERVGIEELNNYVTKLTRESAEMAKTVEEAIVHYPIHFCHNNVDIIDTPGINDDTAMTNITLSMLPKVDAAIMVIMAQSPFSDSERIFLEQKVLSADVGRILFVVTGIDLLDEEDVDRVLENIKNRIETYVLNKAKSTFGENSSEYEMYKLKLGKVRLFGLSAKKALKAKMKHDNIALADSGFLEFEQELELFLTEDRGAIMLNAPVSRIFSSSIEIMKSLSLKENSLHMHKEEFDEKYKIAMEEIEVVRQKREEEFRKINQSARTTYEELQPLLSSYWSNIEKVVYQTVENFEIGIDDIQKDQFEVTNIALSEKIKENINTQAQAISEKISYFIEKALAQEMERFSDFENDFFSSIEKIQNMFIQTSSSTTDTKDDAIVIAGNFFLSAGGIYLGYKEAGWKGALLGGTSGLVGVFTSSVGIGFIFGLLAIPMTLPVLIISGVIASFAGLFSSKWALNKVFATQKIEKFKQSYIDATNAELQKIRSTDDFSHNVQNQINLAFESFREKIRTETEIVLVDMQNRLTQLKIDMAKTHGLTEQEKEKLQNTSKEVSEICERTKLLSEKLVQIIEKG